MHKYVYTEGKNKTSFKEKQKQNSSCNVMETLTVMVLKNRLRQEGKRQIAVFDNWKTSKHTSDKYSQSFPSNFIQNMKKKKNCLLF